MRSTTNFFRIPYEAINQEELEFPLYKHEIGLFDNGKIPLKYLCHNSHWKVFPV